MAGEFTNSTGINKCTGYGSIRDLMAVV